MTRKKPMIRGRFFDGTEFEVDELPATVETDSRMWLEEPNDSGGIQVGVAATGARATFSECADDCDGSDKQWTEWNKDEWSWTIHGTFHLHSEKEETA